MAWRRRGQIPGQRRMSLEHSQSPPALQLCVLCDLIPVFTASHSLSPLSRLPHRSTGVQIHACKKRAARYSNTKSRLMMSGAEKREGWKKREERDEAGKIDGTDRAMNQGKVWCACPSCSQAVSAPYHGRSRMLGQETRRSSDGRHLRLLKQKIVVNTH